MLESFFIRNTIKIAMLIGLTGISQNIIAMQWDLDNQLKQQINIESIKNEFPFMDTQTNKIKIIKALTKKIPFSSLHLFEESGKIVISGKITHFIDDIRITAISTNFHNEFVKIIKKYRSSVDNVSTINNILLEIRELYQEKGYYNVNVDIKKQYIKDKLSYKINIVENNPCRISQVVLGDKLQQHTNAFQYFIGKICNKESIKDRLHELSEKFRSKGYIDNTISFRKFHFKTDKKNIAEIYIKGKIGKKYSFEFDDPQSVFFWDQLLFLDDIQLNGIDVKNLEQVKQEIIKKYKSKGYEDVEVSDAIVTEKNSEELNYKYNINPGIKYFISDIQFEGNHYFNNEDLYDTLDYSTTWNTKITLHRLKFLERLSLIENKYHQNGFWDAKILSTRISKDASNGSAQIIVKISEGKQYTLENILIFGNHFFSNNEIIDQMKLDDKKILTKANLSEYEENIYKMYIERGFRNVEVQLSISFGYSYTSVPTKVTVRITEHKQVYIGRIFIKGLEKTALNVVTRELRFKTGDVLSPKKIDESRKALIKLGIFSSVQITPISNTFSSKNNVLDIDVELYEGNFGNIIFGPGYNWKRGIQYSTEFSYNNLGGTGRRLNLKGSFSQDKNQQSISNPNDKSSKVYLGRNLSLGYIEPFLFDMNAAGNISLMHKAHADQIWQMSNRLEISVLFSLNFSSSTIQFIPFYSFRLHNEEGSDAQKRLSITTGNSSIGSVGLRAKLDERNDRSWTTKGFLLSTDISKAHEYFGSSYNFFKWDITFNHYHSIAETGLIFANSINLTQIENIEKQGRGDSLLPYSERLQVGGMANVRGFEKKLGPYLILDDGSIETTGGTARMLFLSELRYKFTPSWGGAIFVDSGNSFINEQQAKNFSSSGSLKGNNTFSFERLLYHPEFLRHKNFVSFGLSLGFITPLGPINTYISWPLVEPESSDCADEGCYQRARAKDRWLQKYQIDFNIGTEF